MEPATANGSRFGSDSGLIAGDTRDWSRLPEDLLVSVLRALHVADAVRSGAVCTSWNAAYAAFRRFRLPSPKQPPCLLYASDALGPGAAALHCPSTGATLRIPFPRAPLARRPLLGSGHGWLVTADEASNLHLVNPVTGAQVALPPITALHHVERGADEQGDPAYLVYENLIMYNYSKHRFEVNTKPGILDMDDAYECMYFRVVLSAGPSAGRGCVVLLLHMPQGEISFARLGDDRWTWVPQGDDDTGLPWSLDLNGPSPVVRKILDSVPKSADASKYLVQTPAGDILQVWRSREEVDSEIPAEYPPDYVVDESIGPQDPCLELNTIEMQLYKVDLHGHRVELIKSLPEYALFLGYNGSMCLPVKDFPGLKPNCAYMTDDSMEYINFWKHNRREIGIWSLAERSMSKLVDASQTIYPWLNWPSPIWIQPSFF
ncbi:hypothetical protein BDA96_05G185800 [Sorghum bicolor]|uniref:DUF295 domain-containing protein n=2 Tax=Sorghum bicolor TaxID=4558 RepID=A0A921QYT1_SORBI|nr:uncharacterized protein LOC8071999 [Sorghum bicolor]KAG0530432.1 hypothetical protein BDA96_05G185800 [Sorghum bicolor]KXG28817.1 hypothetical protein SORBI_3005G170900 [Sorghum bicolor]|eukprot:XP_021316773.1 uncharacterized protein LOC8071999 [Sorghum bicolor]